MNGATKTGACCLIEILAVSGCSGIGPTTIPRDRIHNDYGYWIADSDFASKRIFPFVMILFSLTESGESAGLPLVTIPAS